MSSLRVAVHDQDHVQGSAQASVTLVEYADYQCPYCGQAYAVIKELQQRFGSALRLVFRNFPLAQMHPQAMPAALVAEYAGQHGRFWQVHDALYENQNELGDVLYEQLLRANDLPEIGLRDAIAAGSLLEHIRADMQGGVDSGVNGTPGFFINGQKFEVRSSYAELAQAIAEYLPATR